MSYTLGELLDMHFCYAAADGNSTKAQRGLYGEEYPNRTILCKDILQNNPTIATYKYIETCEIWRSNATRRSGSGR